jgi:hypothetical protein
VLFMIRTFPFPREGVSFEHTPWGYYDTYYTPRGYTGTLTTTQRITV